jgi:hypothetical protein
MRTIPRVATKADPRHDVCMMDFVFMLASQFAFAVSPDYRPIQNVEGANLSSSLKLILLPTAEIQVLQARKPSKRHAFDALSRMAPRKEAYAALFEKMIRAKDKGKRLRSPNAQP